VACVGEAGPHEKRCSLGAASALARARSSSRSFAAVQGLTLVHFRAQLEDLRYTSLTSELNSSTFGKHPRVSLGYMGDNLS
jgi:hypothetical protein